MSYSYLYPLAFSVASAMVVPSMQCDLKNITRLCNLVDVHSFPNVT